MKKIIYICSFLLLCSFTVSAQKELNKGTKEKIKAQESQAIARAVRLGQTKQIKLIRLLIENSIEENIWKEKYLTNTI